MRRILPSFPFPIFPLNYPHRAYSFRSNWPQHTGLSPLQYHISCHPFAYPHIPTAYDHIRNEIKTMMGMSLFNLKIQSGFNKMAVGGKWGNGSL